MIDREGTKFVRLSKFESSTVFETLEVYFTNSQSEEMIVNYTSADRFSMILITLHYAQFLKFLDDQGIFYSILCAYVSLTLNDHYKRNNIPKRGHFQIIKCNSFM